jgi:hypothetical protein
LRAAERWIARADQLDSVQTALGAVSIRFKPYFNSGDIPGRFDRQDYREVDQHLEQFKLVRRSNYYDTRLYQVGRWSFVFTAKETGPEIIVALKIVGLVLADSIALVKLINDVWKILDKLLETKTRWQRGSACSELKEIEVSVKTAKGRKVLRRVPVGLNQDEKYVQDISELKIKSD